MTKIHAAAGLFRVWYAMTAIAETAAAKIEGVDKPGNRIPRGVVADLL
jgi:hypothetical protein